MSKDFNIIEFVLFLMPGVFMFPVSIHLGGLGVSIVDAYILLLFVLTFLMLSWKGGGGLFNKVPVELYFFLCFSICAFVSFSGSFDKSAQAFRFCIRLVQGAAILFMTLPLFRTLKNPLRTAIKSLLFWGGFVGAFAILQTFVEVGMYYAEEEHRIGGLKHGTAFGAILAVFFVTFAITLAQCLGLRGRERSPFRLNNLLFYIIGLIITGTGLVLAQVRTWIISVIVGFIAYTLLKAKVKQFALLFLVVAVAITLIRTYAPVDDYSMKRFVDLVTIETLLENPRFIKWAASFVIFTKYPLFGVGPYNLHYHNGDLGLYVEWWSEEARYFSDSQYMDLLAMHGFAGTLFFLLANWVLIYKEIRLLRQQQNFTLAIIFIIHVAYMIGAFFWAILYDFGGLAYFMFLANIIVIVDYHRRPYLYAAHQSRRIPIK